MDAGFFSNNRKMFAKLMSEDSVAIFFSGKAPRKSADQFYEFEVDRNFFYLTGIQMEDIILVISKVAEKVTEQLFIPPVDEYYEKWYGILLRKEEATEISGIDAIHNRDAFLPYMTRVLSGTAGLSKVYLYSEYVDWDEPENAYRQFARIIRNQYPAVSIENTLPILTKLRGIKSDIEIKEITRAIDCSQKAFEAVLRDLRPGKFEYQIKAELEYQMISAGFQPSFSTICASGKNATILHYASQRDLIEPGSLVLIDFGAASNQYCADITRTVASGGKFAPRQKELYTIVLEAQRVALEIMRDGIDVTVVNDAVKAYYAKALQAVGLINNANDVEKYYYHSIGHPLGLDPHDLRNQDMVLHNQQVYTVEPGLYIKEEGIGIRIEDDVLITPDGPVVLSKNIIREISDLENAM